MATSILLIYTGGTIGMVQDAETGILKPFDFEHLISEIPELKKFDYRIQTHSFKRPLDSSNITDASWVKLARLIADNYDDYDGFVVLHGSDTMAYTASALSFMLGNLTKPVILTGSQLPIGVIRTDGKENLITAVEIAAAHKNGKPVVPEVAVYFEYQLYRGNRTTKISAAHFEAFSSPNYPVLAEAGIDITYNTRYIELPREGDLSLCDALDSRVGVLKIYPGMNEAYASAVFNAPDLQVVILETYGAGNLPTSDWLTRLIGEAIDKGVKMINVTQCLQGRVKQGAYETSSLLAGMGVISGHDMTLEAALTKSMHLLGQKSDQFSEDFQLPICGEVSPLAS